MRILVSILAVYFLGLNFVPCEDAAVPNQADTQLQQVCQDIDQTSPVQDDNCSPFCNCHCCHAHVTNFVIHSFKALELTISTEIIQKGDSLGEDLPNFHFQPPRV